MNEQKNNKMRFLNNLSDSLQENWADLLARLQNMEKTALASFRGDLAAAIDRQIKVLKKNEPNKKIYRSISNFADKTEIELNKFVGRER